MSKNKQVIVDYDEYHGMKTIAEPMMSYLKPLLQKQRKFMKEWWNINANTKM